MVPRALRRNYQDQGAFDAFCRSFAAELIRNGGNGSLALRTIDPKTAGTPAQVWTRSYKLRNTPLVKSLVAEAQARSQTALARAFERYDISADKAAGELARLAYTELRQVCSWGEDIDPKTGKAVPWLRVKPEVEIDPDAHKAIVSVERRADGSLKVQLADKLAAQMNLARLKGYIQDKPTDVGNAVQLIIQR